MHDWVTTDLSGELLPDWPPDEETRQRAKQIIAEYLENNHGTRNS